MYPIAQPQAMTQPHNIGQLEGSGHVPEVGQSHHQLATSPTDCDESFVERLMERYQYDQAQARHRQQRNAHSSQQSQSQHSSQQLQQHPHQVHHLPEQQQLLPLQHAGHQQQWLQQQQEFQAPQQHRQLPGQDSSQQQRQRGFDMLAELDHVSAQPHTRSASQDSDEGLGQAQWSLTQQGQMRQPGDHLLRQGGHDGSEDRASPQLIYSRGYLAGDHQCLLSQQLESPQFLLGQHSPQGDQSHWGGHSRLAAQQLGVSNAHGHGRRSDDSPGPSSLPQDQSFDGMHFKPRVANQLADQQQLLLRSQALSQPQQAALHRQAMRGSLQQQQSIYQRPQTADDVSGAVEAVRHVQRHSTGQIHDALVPLPQQLHAQAQTDSQPRMQYPQSSWGPAQSHVQYPHRPHLQPHTQPQTHFQSNTVPSAQSSPWEAGEGEFQASLTKKKSSGDMSRHGSGSSSGPLADYVPHDSILV